MKKIKRVKLDVDDLSEADLLAYGQHIKTKLEESTTFDTLDAKTTMLGTALGVLNTRINTVALKQTELDQAAVLLEQQRQEVINILSSLGAGVEQIAEGETTVVIASGFEPEAEPTPVGPLGPPQNLRASMADIEGEIKTRWNVLHGARAYIVQYSLEPGGPWITAGVSPRASFVITGLESGKKYRIRVCGIGAAGQGPWSDEAVKMAA